MRDKNDIAENTRIIDSILPKRLKPGDGRIIDSVLPKHGLLPSTKKLEGKPAGAVKESTEEYTTDDDQYIHHLEEALRHAPCPGCKKLVEGALVGGNVYKKIQQTGRSVKEIKEEEMEQIKQEVKDKYGL